MTVKEKKAILDMRAVGRQMALSPGYDVSRTGNRAFTGCLYGEGYRALAR